VESFRADQDMSIKKFRRVVQKDWNMTPSTSKLQRAKRITMTVIMEMRNSSTECYGIMQMR
jgi:hypothetical protein